MNEKTQATRSAEAEKQRRAERDAAKALQAKEKLARQQVKDREKKKRDAITAAMILRLERIQAAHPNITKKWNAERAAEDKKIKDLKKKIAKRTTKDLTSKRFMLDKPVKLPDPIEQPDLTAADPADEAPPREGLIPGTYKVLPLDRLRSGLLDKDPLPPRWTARHVGNRLIEAMDVLRITPIGDGPKSYGAAWPAYRNEGVELAYQAGAGTLDIGRNRIVRVASAEEVARANQALQWPMQFLMHCNAWALGHLTRWAIAAAQGEEDRDENPPEGLLKFIAEALNAAKEPVR